MSGKTKKTKIIHYTALSAVATHQVSEKLGSCTVLWGTRSLPTDPKHYLKARNTCSQAQRFCLVTRQLVEPYEMCEKSFNGFTQQFQWVF